MNYRRNNNEIDFYKKSIILSKGVHLYLKDAKHSTTMQDCCLDIACFSLQQSIEFILKAFLIHYHIDYTTHGMEGHNITALVEKLKDKIGFSFELSEDLDRLAPMMTLWETRSRYQSGIKTKISSIYKGLDIHKALLTKFERECLKSDQIREEWNDESLDR